MAMRRSSGLSRQQLKLENIRRCQKAGVPVGAEPEKPIGLKAYRQKVKQSAKEAAKAEAKRGTRIFHGGGFSPR